LQRTLLKIGLTPEQADRLLTSYPHERIRRQLEWLPLRGAKNRASFLIAAITHDYGPPQSMMTSDRPETRTEGNGANPRARQ
jgi:hypothetical protein